MRFRKLENELRVVRSWNDNIIKNEKLLNSKAIAFQNLIE
jgi:hypothetical protein